MKGNPYQSDPTLSASSRLSRKWTFLKHPNSLIKISLLHTRGSAPRHRGFLVILAEGETDFPLCGSIGGGLVEYQAILHAREWIRSPLPKSSRWLRMVRSVSLNPDFGQCCGGEVTLLYEYLREYEKRNYLKMLLQHPGAFLAIPHASHLPVYAIKKKKTPKKPASKIKSDTHHEEITPTCPTLYLYGAGHVGRALIHHLRPLPLTLYWVDVAQGRFPGDFGFDDGADITPVIDPEMSSTARKAPPQALHLIMTFDHVIDYRLVKILVRKKVGFLGLIGSKTKARKFRQALKNDGFSPPQIGKLTCPIGVGLIRGKAPHAIALDTVMQLVGMISERWE